MFTRPSVTRYLFQASSLMLGLMLLSYSWANAQSRTGPDYEIRRLTVRDGLVNHTISGFGMDGAGALWIATQSGLYTFDGFRLDRFDVQNIASRQLPSSLIIGLEVDTVDQNLVFICTAKGIVAVDPIEHQTVPDTALGLPAGFLQTCTQIKKSTGGFFWLLRGQTLYKLVKTTSKRYECQLVRDLPVNKTPTLQADPSAPDGLWIFPPALEAYYLNVNGLEHYVIPANKTHSNAMSGLTQWLYTDKSILGLDAERNIYRFDAGQKRIELVNSQYDLYDLLPEMEWVDNYIEQKSILNCFGSILAGQKVFGTSQGLFIVRQKFARFHTIEPLRGEEIRGIYAEASGKWWAGSYSGLFTGHLFQDQVQRADLKGVWAFLPLEDNHFLLGLEHPTGIIEWDMKLNKKVPDTGLLAQLDVVGSNARNTLSLCRDERGVLWAGTYKHLLWATATPPYQFHYWMDNSTGKARELKFVRVLESDKNTGIWVGHENGLLHLVYNEQQKRYDTAPLSPDLNGIPISDLYQDRFQRVWIATKGKGIACLDLKNLQMPPLWYNSEGGLCNDMTCRIEGSNNDEVLWISTHNGLSRFNTRSGRFQNFYEDSGFFGNEFNSAASAKFPNGALLFGGVFGMLRFHPDSIPWVDVQHKTILSGASYYDQDSKLMNTLNPSPQAGLFLPPYPEYLGLRIGSTEFLDPVKQHFRYRLHGLSELWTYIGGEGEVKFIRLAPGHYIFEAQAILFDGHLATPVFLPVFVETPVYETWWFKTLLVVFSLGIGYLAYQYRVRQLLREQLMRQQIADDLHDDIGNKLNIISIAAQKIAKSQPENSPQVIELNNLVDTSRNALRSLHTMIWSVDSRKDRLSSLFDRMQDFADGYLRPLQIKFKFDIKATVSNRYINLKVRHHIIMIYQELLTNMVKHTRPTLVTISIKLLGDTLHLNIVNEYQVSAAPGMGASSTNRGLSSIERRLNRINGQYTWVEPSEDRQEIYLVVPQVFKRF